jgi:hypothetical protein
MALTWRGATQFLIFVLAPHTSILQKPKASCMPTNFQHLPPPLLRAFQRCAGPLAEPRFPPLDGTAGCHVSNAVNDAPIRARMCKLATPHHHPTRLKNTFGMRPSTRPTSIPAQPPPPTLLRIPQLRLQVRPGGGLGLRAVGHPRHLGTAPQATQARPLPKLRPRPPRHPRPLPRMRHRSPKSR